MNIHPVHHAGWRISEIARHVGCDPKTVRAYLNGERVCREFGARRHRTRLTVRETAAAQDKADALQGRFSEWEWEDPVRAADLVAEYNRRFNSIVLRDYSNAGGYLTLPGSRPQKYPDEGHNCPTDANEPVSGREGGSRSVWRVPGTEWRPP